MLKQIDIKTRITWASISEILENLGLHADNLKHANNQHELKLPDELIELAKKFCKYEEKEV